MTLFALAHLLVGTVACLSGLTSLVSKKGAKLHRKAGRVFVISMVFTAGGGAAYAVDRPESLTGMVGLFTCYLVLTAFHAVLPRGKWAGVLDVLCILAAVFLAVAFFVFGAYAPPMITEYKIPPAVYYTFGAIALLAAAGDMANYSLGGTGGQWKIARHLWRMGFALYIAAGSLLDGPGTRIFPDALEGSLWLTAPVHLVGATVLVWLVIALFSNRFKPPLKTPPRSPATATENITEIEGAIPHDKI